MNINETKIEVKSWNNYPLAYTHKPGEGEGLIRLTLHPRTITHGCQKDVVSENKPIRTI